MNKLQAILVRLGDIYEREPLRCNTVIVALLLFAVSLGLPISDDQRAAFEKVLGGIAGVVMIATGEVSRTQVTPIAAPQIPIGTDIVLTPPK